QVADMAWGMKCREEDLEYRRLEMEWRKHDLWCRWVDEQWHAMEEKAKQLEQIAQLSALLAGFALVAMCQMQIPDGVNGWLLVSFGTVTAAAVGVPLIAMLSSTLVLVAVIKYDPKVAVNAACPDFGTFWSTHCEADWRLSFRCFNISIALFLMVLGQVGWIQFFAHQNYVASSTLVTVVAVASAMVYFLYTYRKWSTFLA
ncbi:calcium release-activated calcium channel protein, partial [Tribonema minus]